VVLDKILRMGEGKILRHLRQIAEAVNALEEDYVDLSDAELRAQTDVLRQRLADGETLDDILFEAFAVVREAAKRTLGQRHFDVQIMGGAALHMGNIAEMKTGEGKTLVATLPAYLNALAGKGVHVVTVNDYLAQYHADLMGRVYGFLGMTTGVVLSDKDTEWHRKAYRCDITYGTNNEFGFDYLRDNMAWSHEELVQRGHFFAIVDEVDSILIDEARTPLIISGPAEHNSRWYTEFARIAPRLIREVDYEVDEAKRTIGITEGGIAKVEDQIGIDNLYESVNTPLVGYLNNALKAKELYKRDKDYIVNDGEVLIVDEFTGRILHGRRYNEGMHQAIEAKEHVEIKAENQTFATITLQNYFRMYDKLSGMTGTAQTEAGEFHKTYELGVVPVPTNKPMIRADQADVVYKSEDGKFEAVVDDIAERNRRGQPVLVGTVSVEKSERLSTMLARRGVPHEVLNAKQHAREAEIVAQAGRKGAVTVATNMAGRGTDIMLGGNAEFLARADLRRRGILEHEDPDAYAAAWPDVYARYQKQCTREHQEVVAAGGLYVLGTERHESRRIDNQLRGRSGRQGDPGESRFYLSLQDDLMRMFNASAVERIMDTLNIPEDVPIESKMVTRAIRNAQHQIEQQNQEIRKNVLKYDEVLNKQREVIYAERRRVLEGADLHEQVRGMIDDTIRGYVQGATADLYAEDWDLDTLWNAFRQLFPISVTVEELETEAGGRDGLDADTIAQRVIDDAHAAYDKREAEFGPEVMRQVERQVVLQVLDRKWREHLYEMDYLQEGIGLRAYAQRDPLVEYRREGYDLFATMMEGIKEESVGFLFHVEIQVEQAPVEEAPAEPAPVAPARNAQGAPAAPPTLTKEAPPEPPLAARAKGLQAPRRPSRLQYSSPSVDGDASPVVRTENGEQQGAAGQQGQSQAGQAAAARRAANQAPGQAVGHEPSRNAPCPCGSGRKYKRCHGAPGGPE
jgi:preprotein translocase subunit SecA